MGLDFSSPEATKSTLASSCEIKDLADVDLAAIFKHLPPVDRLLVSEVCKRWHGISRKAWLEIAQLDLSSIPGPNILAIIRQCPNLRSVSALRKTLDVKILRYLSRISLTSLRLLECTAVLKTPFEIGRIDDLLAVLFSDSLQDASWEELVLHRLMVAIEGDAGVIGIDFPATFPRALRRLQISGLSWRARAFITGLCYSSDSRFLAGLDQLGHLESLMLHRAQDDRLVWDAPRKHYRSVWDDILVWNAYCNPDFRANIGRLQNLREIFLEAPWLDHTNYATPLLSLPRLEAAFFHDVYFAHSSDFVRLATKHPALRILVLTGHLGTHMQNPMEFPMRVRYGNGLSADPLPQLQIFVGKMASEKIRFPTFPSDAAKVYPISEPLPQFLDRADIKPIFEGIWIAEKIKEAAKEGSLLYDYESDVAESLLSVGS